MRLRRVPTNKKILVSELEEKVMSELGKKLVSEAEKKVVSELGKKLVSELRKKVLDIYTKAITRWRTAETPPAESLRKPYAALRSLLSVALSST